MMISGACLVLSPHSAPIESKCFPTMTADSVRPRTALNASKGRIRGAARAAAVQRSSVADNPTWHTA